MNKLNFADAITKSLSGTKSSTIGRIARATDARGFAS